MGREGRRDGGVGSGRNIVERRIGFRRGRREDQFVVVSQA